MNIGVTLSTTFTRKGQITVPLDIRKSLGFKQGDRVNMRLENNRVIMEKTGSIVSRTAGIFKSDAKPYTAEELREIAEHAIADSVVMRSKG